MFLKLRPIYCGSALLAALVLGLAVGAADAAFMYFALSGTWKLPYINHLFWLWVPLLWAAICVGVALVFSLPFLRRFMIPALVVSGPGLLLLGRGAAVLRDLGILSNTTVALIWLGVNAILIITATWVVELRPARFSRSTAFAAAAWLMGALAVLAASRDTLPWRRAAPAAKQNRPNVVVVFMDTVRWDDTGLAEEGGHSTPHLARFAAGATTFDNAWAPAPWTLPSHSAVYTGIEPWRASLGSRTIAERLTREGYETAAVFANPLLTPGVDFTRGLRHIAYSVSSAPCQSGIGHLLLRMHEQGVPMPRMCGWMLASEVTQQATKFIDNAPRPYYLTLNYFDAHLPYYVPKECGDIKFEPYTTAELAAAQEIERTRVPLSDKATAHLRNQHKAALNCMDRSLGSLFAALQRQPDYENTVIAVLADHGEQFGKHFRFGHGNSVYRQVLHVPFVLRVPGRAPSRIDAPVTITDLHDTILQALHLDRAPHTDLALFDPDQRHLAISEYLDGPPGTQSFSAADDRHHLIVNLRDRQELYDYMLDPTETQPLPDGSRRRRVVGLHEQLRQVRTQWDGNRRDIPAFRGLGYLE